MMLNSHKFCKDNYNELSNDQTRKLLHTLYITEELSWGAIAKLMGTYPKRIQRDAHRLNIPSRTKQEAQTIALKSNRHKHPTKGTTRSDAVKAKIGTKIADVWSNLTDDEKQYRIQIGKDSWNKKTDAEKVAVLDKAHAAIRRASKEGSKLEIFLATQLRKHDYRVALHKEHYITREKLQIDLLLPDLNVAIEVDGPSHYSNIWGEQEFRRVQNTDKIKNGLLLARGLVVIRIKQAQKTLSQHYQRQVFKTLLTHIHRIKESFPPHGQRYLEI